MRKLIANLAFLALTAVTACGEEPTAVKTLIITGDQDGSWQETTSVLREILTAAGHDVDVTEKPRSYLTPDKLAAYDVLVLNYKQTDVGAKANPEACAYPNTLSR